jgi:hypothetical protein
MSSVFGLKASPQRAKLRPCRFLAETGDDLVDQHPLLGLVRRFDRHQHAEIDARLVAGANQRFDILGKTRAAVAGAGVEKVRADARVAADAVAHQFDVGADALGQAARVRS